MRNIVIEGLRSASLWPIGHRELAADFCTCPSEGKIFVATSNGRLACFACETLKEEWHVEVFPSDLEGLRFTSVSYHLELDSVCVSLSSGSLILIHSVTQAVEEVGCVERGIMALEWSPDGDVLAMITGMGNLLIMSQEWEALAEVALSDEIQGIEDADAKITWRGDGKFFSTSFKTLSGPRCIKIWDRVTFEVHSSVQQSDHIALPMCWQPNGRHLYACRDNNSVTDRVLLFERNGLAHGGFDLVPGSGTVHGMHWSSDSELLAVTLASEQDSGSSRRFLLQIWHRSNWHWYLKFEKHYRNGGKAPLLLQWDEKHVNTLHVISGGGYERLIFGWHTNVTDLGTSVVLDGNQLLVTPLRHTVIPPPMSAVRVRLPSPAIALALMDASTEGDDGCEVIAAGMSDGRLAMTQSVEDDLWEETLEEQCGSSMSGLDCVLPWILDLPCNNRHGQLQKLCWLDSSTLLALVSPGLSTIPERGLQQEDQLWELHVCTSDGSPWFASSPPSAPSSIRSGPVTPLGGPFHAMGLVPLLHGGRPPHIPSTVAASAVIQGEGGALKMYTKGGRIETLAPSACLPEQCTSLSFIPLPSSVVASRPIIGLSASSGKLYWGSELVASEVTSFALRSGGAGGPALLYTTRRSLLYTVFFKQLMSGSYHHRELLASNVPKPGSQMLQDEQQGQTNDLQQQPAQQKRHQPAQKLGAAGIYVRHDDNKRDDDMRAAMHAAMRPSELNAAARDIVVRAVEQGSRLVSVPRDGIMAVLQMPRGNLETVSPRALVLAAIAEALDHGKYGEAWRLASLNRVDLNLLVDYRWPSILPEMVAFAKAVPRPADLCDLLFALSPGSIIEPGGIYASILLGGADVRGDGSSGAGGVAETHLPGADKVDVVCDAMREAVEQLPGGRGKYLTVIATAYARKQARQLDQALACVREAKESALAATSAGSSGAAEDVAEKTLRHLLLHVDAEELYRVALGMYDLPLAYMVISNAQRDPGEYMAELQRFGSIADESLRRHSIDMHLRRFPQAVTNLFAAGPEHFPQALCLAKEHGLLRMLLSLCPSPREKDERQEDNRRLQILDAYGDSLEAERKHEDAGVAFLAAGQLTKAMHSYRAANQWRLVFVLARRLEYSEARVQELAVQVSDELASSGLPAEGAMVLLQYLEDVDNAVSLLAHAKEWREALHTSLRYQRQDLVDTVVAPAAAAAAAGLLSDARESVERVNKYSARLREVRGKRQAMAAAMAADAEDGGDGQPDIDAMSDVNSLMTSLSMYTENTHTGETLASGTTSGSGRGGTASTQGGRRAQARGKKGKAKGGKIRQGSPQEEASLVEHVGKLVPGAAALTEAGQLCELLVLLGHFEDARVLQRELAKWLSEHKDAMDDIAKHPLPDAPHQGGHPKPPERPLVQQPEWKWAILRE